MNLRKSGRYRTMELGSEFNLDLLNLNISPNSFLEYMGDMQYCLFDSGRSALKAISTTLGDGYILMPEYICESVLKCFSSERIVFYRLKDDLQIDLEDFKRKLSGDVSAVYLMHYFGSLQPENVLAFIRAEKEKYGFAIIEDTTHSIFSEKQTIGDYCAASLRKWFPVPNGGVLYTGNFLNLHTYDEIKRSADNCKAYAMVLKTLYLNGRFDCNTEYRRIFTECEEKLDTQGEVKRISDFSEFLLRCIDVEDFAKKRRSNLNCLKDRLSGIGMKQIVNFAEKDCPLALPVLVPDRDGLHNYLAKNKIYCAVHWPFDGNSRNERPLGVFLSEHMISLPIDQRYGKEEMEHLFQVIDEYKGRLRF